MMSTFRKIALGFVVIFLGTESFAQFQNVRPQGIKGTIGFGLTEYSVLSPKSDFKLDDGIFTSISGEAPLNFLGLFVTIGLNYMQTSGQTNYDYRTLSEHYAVDDISFDASTYQISLGFKFKPIRGILSPYVEGGGLMGYQTIEYKNRRTELNAIGSNYKTKDGLMETGYYGDAGLEVTFSERFGVKAGYKYIKTESRPFVTLGDQKVKYDARVLHFGVTTQF